MLQFVLLHQGKENFKDVRPHLVSVLEAFLHPPFPLKNDSLSSLMTPLFLAFHAIHYTAVDRPQWTAGRCLQRC